MNAAVENSSQTSLEKAVREKPVSVYNVNFTPVVYNFTEKRFLPERKVAPREIVVAQAPPAVVVEQRVAAPGPDYIWVEGAWVWRHDRWDWERGKWVRPPRRSAEWVPAHYRVQNGRHVYIPGYWK